MPLVSVTRLRVRSWRYILPFMFFTLRSYRQAKVAEGNLHVALLRDAKNTFWTRTVWTTEGDMKSFTLSGTHRRVMPRLLDWCDEAAVVHWVQDTNQPPDWYEARDRIQQEGRRSKVRYPSLAHEKFEVPRPRLHG
jgi:alkanesulfonate monooxygenase SsuD/methylene tetrahydromethanopterin reductase-like flavin-dependent oxidoreductase (luciferase family)